MRRLSVFLLELAVVALGVVLGAASASRFRLIPKALLHLPQIDFSASDIRVVAAALVGGAAVALLGLRAFAGGDPLRSPRRAASELYALLVGIVAATLGLFLFTQIAFSPELLLQSTLVTMALLVLLYAVLTRRAAHGVGAALVALLRETGRLLRSPLVWLALIFALSPVAVARRFTTDRDFANWVTAIRVAANRREALPYSLINALGETRFTTPIMMQFARHDPHTLYVLTRGGQLWRADYPAGTQATRLLDLADRVGYVEMENGALGFDLHPDFGRPGTAGEGYVYVYFTEYRADGQTNRLTRFDLRPPTPDARLATATPLIAQGRNNDGYHNAGSVVFGPDGFLYVSVGEASASDCHQRVDCALVGGILRLDVDKRGGETSRPIGRQPLRGSTANYYIPRDNPYAGDSNALGEFWAHGLRNPFRIAFDRGTGELWAGDVGSTVWEEVNRITRGGNYEYPWREGNSPQAGIAPPAAPLGTPAPPVLFYRHTAFLRSVIGGTVYRGKRWPDLEGNYLFMDNYSGELMAIPARAAPLTEHYATLARSPEVAQRGVTALIEAPDGEVLISVMGDNDHPTGMIARLAEADAANAVRAAPVPKAAATVSAADATRLFGVNCARCHGAGGRGDGPDSQRLGDFVPDFTSEGFHRWRSDDELLTAIREGGTAVGRGPMMPPWQGVLREGELLALRDLVRRWRPAGPSAGGSAGASSAAQ